MRWPRSLSRHSLGVRNRAPWGAIIGQSIHQFHENDLFTPAAAMSYFWLLALFPALLVLLALSNRMEVGNEVLSRMVELYPGSREFLRATVHSLSNVGPGIIATCVVVVLWAGSWVFSVIEHAINRIWNCRPRPFLHGRALTLGMIGAVGLLLSVSVFFTSFLLALEKLAARMPMHILRRFFLLAVIGNSLTDVILAIVSLVVTIVLFTLVYRFMPNSPVKVLDCLPAAVIAGLLWEAAKYIFAGSLQYFHYDEIYGSVGAVVAVLTWSYFSSLIMMFGAQLSAVFYQEHSSIKPGPASDCPS